MTAEQFESFWAFTYPNTIPISHYFKLDYPDRWFRIHSLPASKRYANTATEWHELLSRQNQLLTDLLGGNGNVLLVTGDYELEGSEELHPLTAVDSIRGLSFTALPPIDLNHLSPKEYEAEQVFKPVVSAQIWQPHRFDDVLRAIADDSLRAFFVLVEHGCLVAPYDGGVDCVVKDRQTKEACLRKYCSWLSARADGY